LVGHSWGSFLGVQIVKRRSELFRAFVGTGQVVSWRNLVKAQYDYTLTRARTDSNASAVAALEALGMPAPDNFAQYLILRRWLNGYLAPSDVRWIGDQDALVRAALGPDEISAYWRGLRTMSGLSSTVFSMDLTSAGANFRLPVFLIEGREDHIAPPTLAQTYFDAITAPFKRMAYIEGAGHFAITTHTVQFAAVLREDIRLLDH
jgi:pimeloyl-ACP methyl ester carboxylesterase